MIRGWILGAVLVSLSLALGTASGGDFPEAHGWGSLGLLRDVVGSEGGTVALSAAGMGKSGGKLSPMAEVAKVRILGIFCAGFQFVHGSTLT